MTRSRTAFSLLALASLLAWGCSQSQTGAVQSAPGTSSADLEKVLIPDKSWNCMMEAGIPKPESGTLLLEAEMKLDNVYDVGKTPFGKRQAIVTQTGTMKGPKIEAGILAGGLDFELTPPQRRRRGRANPRPAHQRRPLRHHAQRRYGVERQRRACGLRF